MDNFLPSPYLRHNAMWLIPMVSYNVAEFILFYTKYFIAEVQFHMAKSQLCIDLDAQSSILCLYK